MRSAWDFHRAPLIVIWELTRACALACRHCRAEAIPWRHPLELTTDEGRRLLEQIRDMGTPAVVLTGGDPLERPDFFDLVRYGTELGLSVSASPSGTPRVTRQAMARAAEAGLRRVAFSLDGATEATHDAFRGVPGSFRWTLDGMRFAREAGMEVQVNTTVCRQTVAELPAIAERVAEVGAVLWSLFFLVPVGRARAEDMLAPEEHEQVLRWMVDLGRRAPFAVKATEAPFYRRVLLQARDGAPGAERSPRRPAPGSVASRSALGPGLPEVGPGGFYALNDGRGFAFVSHTGEVYPSGFLPLSAGSVRRQPLAEIYRESPLFQALRDANRLRGKCGVCEFRHVCGGSRARAWALTGDYLASDPACPYVPAACREAAADAAARTAPAAADGA